MQLECPKCRGHNAVPPPGPPGARVRLDLRALFERVESLAEYMLSGDAFREGGTSQPHLARGKRFVREERYAQAFRELDAAGTTDPKNFESHFRRGRALLKLNRDAGS